MNIKVTSIKEGDVMYEVSPGVNQVLYYRVSSSVE